MKISIKTRLTRATLTLALMLLTATTAWAEADVIVKYLDPTAAIGAQRKSVTNPGLITAETTAIGTADTETWYYVSGTVTCSNRIEVSGTVNLILADGCNFTASKGLHVPSGSALNIYAQSIANRGSLTADNYCNDAAIGGNGGEDESKNATGGKDSGAITIYGGTITTYGNIGGGDGGNGRAYNEHFENNDEDGTLTDSWEESYAGYGGNGGSGNVAIYSGYIIVSGNIGGGKAGTGQNKNGNEDEDYYGSNGGGTVNLSWATTTDVIHADNYYGTVTLQKAFYNIPAGEVIDNNDLKDVYLMFAGTPYTVKIGSMPEGVTATADLELNAGFKNAVEGQVVTICFSGVPAGKVPVVYYDYMLGTYPQHDPATVNGDGTVSFTMPAANVTITAELKKDIANCEATVPDQTLSAYSSTYHYVMQWDNIMYKFESANSPASNGFSVGEEVKDGETLLTLGTDYRFGAVEVLTGDGSKAGDECRVEIVGQGDYAGSNWVNFTIIGASASGTWGDNLSWSLSEGTLTITGSGAMQAAGSNSGYPWYPYGSYINIVILDNNITTIPAYAFAGASQLNTYAGVTTFKRRTGNEGNYTYTEGLPTSLTAIGDNAFAYCNNAKIIVPSSVTTFGTTTPFNQVGYYDNDAKEIKGGVFATLSDAGDNSALIGALYLARYVNVTLDGRTLYKDGAWNTLCLPFDMTNAQVTAQLAPNGLMELDLDGYYANNIRYEKREDGNYYDGSTAYTGEEPLQQTGFDATSGTLNLFFIDATSIEAGKPYLIKWDKPNDYVAYNGENAATCSDLVNHEFSNLSGVTIETSPIAVTSTDDYVTFMGTYSPIVSDDENKSILLVGGSSLYYPDGSATTNINAFRSYFQLNNGLEVGNTNNQVREFKLNFGEEKTTGISLTPDPSRGGEGSSYWYSLDGRKLSEKPTTKGIYVNRGRKIVIK